MIITHQTVLDEEGKPTAAIIPWDEFEAIQERLADENEISDEWRQEIGNRAREIDEGKVELIEGDDFLKRLKAV